jgi:hypothetical protein
MHMLPMKNSKTNCIKTYNMPYGAAPSNNSTMVASDFDTKVHKQRTYCGTVDMHGLHPSTIKKGKPTVNFTMSKNMVKGLWKTRSSIRTFGWCPDPNKHPINTIIFNQFTRYVHRNLRTCTLEPCMS